MHNILKEIITKTKHDLKVRKQKLPLKKLQLSIGKIPSRPFLKKLMDNKSLSVIAEVKLSSPTQKNLGTKKEIISRVKKYQHAGADFVSVITEKYFFYGDSNFVTKIKKAVSLPILQKDFIVDPYQLYEAKIAGPDAILLIAKIVSKKDLILLVKIAQKLGLEPIVEINNIKELKNALKTSTKIVAVNARNLDTFVVNIDNACKLLKKIPNKYTKLGFSGISTKEDVQKYKNAGVDGILIGTNLMKAKNIKKYLNSLLNVGVKICGVRTKKAALAACKTGADFLGFNFVPTSKRYINPFRVLKIISPLKGKIKIVGVFQNEDSNYVNKIAQDLGLDFVQLHGKEDSKYLKKIKFPVIKALRENDDMNKLKTSYILLDRAQRGSGKMVHLKKARDLATKFPIFYAGGLTPDNVAMVVKKVQPFAVDVAGGIETDGMQDIKKIKQFIKNAKEAA